MKYIFNIIVGLIPFIMFSQEDSPSEIRRETNLEVFGD